MAKRFSGHGLEWISRRLDNAPGDEGGWADGALDPDRVGHQRGETEPVADILGAENQAKEL